MAVQTSNDVANQALMMVGDNVPAVTGQNPTFDNSTAGKALQKLYGPCVQTVLKQFGWDFARRLYQLTASGNASPFPFGFTGEYLYPAFALEIWQVQSLVPVDIYNPLPVDFTIGNTLVGGAQTKVVWTSLATPYAALNNNPTENVWDAAVREAVVRLLGSELAEAISGRPDTSESLLKSGAAFGEMAKARGG